MGFTIEIINSLLIKIKTKITKCKRKKFMTGLSLRTSVLILSCIVDKTTNYPTPAQNHENTAWDFYFFCLKSATIHKEDDSYFVGHLLKKSLVTRLFFNKKKIEFVVDEQGAYV